MATSVNERICKACAASKELTKDNWYPNKGSKDGFRQPCRDCVNENQRKHYENNPEYYHERSVCAYHKDIERSRRQVREARKRRLSTAEGRAQHNARNKAWKDANTEQVRAAGREYATRYRQEQPEKARESRRKNYEKNRDSFRERAHRRRAGINGESFTKEQFAELVEQFNGCCAYCLAPDDNLTADHMRPISKGGGNEIENIVPACQKCNGQKHSRTLLEVTNGTQGIRLFKP